MRRSAITTSPLTWIFACAVFLLSPPSHATEPDQQETAGGDTRKDDTDGAIAITLQEALRMAVQAAETLETADADARSALIERVKALMATIRTADPANPWLDYVVGYVHIVSGRSGDAIESMETFLETREGRNYWRSHRLLGDLLVSRYPRLARASYAKADALKSNEPTVLFGLARCLASKGDTSAAIEYVTNAIVADTNETIPYTRFLAQMFMRKNQWSQALGTARQAVAMAERKLEQGGDVLVGLQRIDAELALAIDAASGLMQAQPDNEQAYLTAAQLLRTRSDNAHRASRLHELQFLKSAIEALKENASAELLEAYAVLLAETGQTEDAIGAFERLLLKDPANVGASDWLARLRFSPNDEVPARDDENP